MSDKTNLRFLKGGKAEASDEEILIAALLIGAFFFYQWWEGKHGKTN